MSAAEGWRASIVKATGELLAICDDRTAEVEKEILIGSTNRAVALANVSELHYDVRVSGSKLVVTSGGVYSEEKLPAIFKELYLDTNDTLELTESTPVAGNLLSEPTLDRAEGADIRIMSANILAEFPSWNAEEVEIPIKPRLEIFLANLYAYAPDVVCAEEVSENWAAMLEAELGNGYKLILNEKSDNTANYSLLIYNSNTVELVDSGIQPYTERDNNKCRNMAWGIFKTKSANEEFAVISTHWNVVANVTYSQGTELNAMIVELSASDTRPVLVGGDFNCGTYRNVEYYNAFADAGNVNNLKANATTLRNDVHTGKTAVGVAGTDAYCTVDYLFGTDDVQSLMFMTVVENCTADMSDHNAIMADVSLN